MSIGTPTARAAPRPELQATETIRSKSCIAYLDGLMFSVFKKSVLFLVDLFVRRRLRDKLVIPEKAVFSRFTEVRLEDGSSFGDVQIGDNVMIHCRLISQAGGKIKIGSGSNIRRNTLIGAVKSVEIGRGVIISNDVVIVDNNNHPVDPVERERMVASGWSNSNWMWKHSASDPVVIEDNVWIGQFSRIAKGVRIGKNSIVAANAVVTKNVPENVIVAGNPARVVKILE